MYKGISSDAELFKVEGDCFQRPFEYDQIQNMFTKGDDWQFRPSVNGAVVEEKFGEQNFRVLSKTNFG